MLIIAFRRDEKREVAALLHKKGKTLEDPSHLKKDTSRSSKSEKTGDRLGVLEIALVHRQFENVGCTPAVQSPNPLPKILGKL